jgi:hypothetical protein
MSDPEYITLPQLPDDDWLFTEARDIMHANPPQDAVEDFTSAQEKASWVRPSVECAGR